MQRNLSERIQENEVSLLFREDPSILGKSKANAFKRLQDIECRFRKDLELQIKYTAFMDEYIKLGHMSALSDAENLTINYLPHYAVMKETSTSTKLRVVFLTRRVRLPQKNHLMIVYWEDLRSNRNCLKF